MHCDRKGWDRDRGDYPGRPRGGPEEAPDRDEGCCCQDNRGEGDHLDQTVGLWKQAFFEALQEVRVELLKARIKAACGRNMEETAKAVFDSMLKEWKETRKKAEEAAKTQEEPELDVDQALKEAIKKALKKGPQSRRQSGTRGWGAKKDRRTQNKP
jgi:hypothetical protein